MLTDGTLREREQNSTERIQNGNGTDTERIQNEYRTGMGTRVERKQNAFGQAFPVRFLLIGTVVFNLGAIARLHYKQFTALAAILFTVVSY